MSRTSRWRRSRIFRSRSSLWRRSCAALFLLSAPFRWTWTALCSLACVAGGTSGCARGRKLDGCSDRKCRSRWSLSPMVSPGSGQPQ
ncbi:uncharacterized protein B0H18DRAFT_994441 [Fomitopsis serialis]|uniref:uncharacterized protein n=1 Tax=Fomitopsis serialis TaxID=139415 RepID=UPI00200864D5|nr:uncharacterized protein B0H18DRAFT_994441 [Neoantrodia serialis]KAH9930330.1 hypothetical protein B0H18DRAFT_994441 [Neoantrodia serialis]